MKKRVLLGMSGGIDSSVSAMVLQEKGYIVVGITFLFSEMAEVNKTISRDARVLAEKLGIKHITIDLQKEFKNSVIKYFVNEYMNGKTPFPCAYCNPKVKFYYLEEYAKKENCSFIATGHYAQIKSYKGKKYIYQGVDPEKDQSFFLWGLSENTIQKLIFPLGEFEKSAIRIMAKERGFVQLSKQKDSLGICFIEGSDYRNFLKKEGVKSEPGNFVDTSGYILGKHQGITNYTVGQRRGLGLNLNYPVFVAKINLDDNEIVLAKYKDLYRNTIVIKDLQVPHKQCVMSGRELVVKVRYRLQETPCELNILEGSRAELRLLEPEAMIAAGQTAVFYEKDRLVGGGFIESSE